MIITLIFLIAFVVSLISYLIKENSDHWFDTEVECLGMVLSGVCLIIFVMIIIGTHIGTPNAIEQNRIQYESLIQRREAINSGYEDVSKSDVIKDIAEWNSTVQGTRYWTYNPWTSWFWPKRVADNMRFIE